MGPPLSENAVTTVPQHQQRYKGGTNNNWHTLDRNDDFTDDILGEFYLKYINSPYPHYLLGPTRVLNLYLRQIANFH